MLALRNHLPLAFYYDLEDLLCQIAIASRAGYTAYKFRLISLLSPHVLLLGLIDPNHLSVLEKTIIISHLRLISLYLFFN